jgi:hypothetical protein
VKHLRQICSRNKNNLKMKTKHLAFILLASLTIASCKKEEEMMEETPMVTPLDPASAPQQPIDRFSAQAGTLMIRDAANGLPGPNEAINFDQGPFITQGFGPDGEQVSYYNFDVMSTDPAPIYVLFKEGATAPVPGQINLVDVIPGDNSYNDFWNVVRVTVPNDYVANTVTSVAQVFSRGYDTENTGIIVNCPIVPLGSTASMRVGGGDNGLVRAWYNNKVVNYFNFSEAPLMGSTVPTSPIYVTFNINPDVMGGGPPSGFLTSNGVQTHNVLFSLPGDSDYSPLWSVTVYNNSDFPNVSNALSAAAATIMAEDVMTVNCPLASIN